MATTSPTNALRRNYVSAPADEFIITTLELRHSQFTPGVFWLNDSPKDVTATLESGTAQKFTAFPFQIKLPTYDNQGRQELAITITNAGQELVTEIELASRKPEERIEVVLRIYLSSDLTGPQTLPLRLAIDALSITDQAITATANRADVLNMPFPAINFEPRMFPGLIR